MKEVEAIFAYAQQYTSCAVNHVPYEVAKAVYDTNPSGNRGVYPQDPYTSLRFENGVFCGAIGNRIYAMDDCFELEDVADYEDVIADSAKCEPENGIAMLLDFIEKHPYSAINNIPSDVVAEYMRCRGNTDESIYKNKHNMRVYNGDFASFKFSPYEVVDTLPSGWKLERVADWQEIVDEYEPQPSDVNPSELL